MLPEDFIQQTRALLGDDLYHRFAEGVEAPPPVSIRLNPWKSQGLQPNSALADGKVPWCPDGYYLATRPAFTFDPLLHGGAYYVQDASSMFLDHVLRHLVKSPVTALDLCAAPGGKSTVALAALPAGSLLVANEPIATRANILAENLRKHGHPDTIVTCNYPADYAANAQTFDLIIADVPCSGEGMFRKDEGAVEEWSLQNVENCWRLQREIVDSAWHCLRPGGLLIYSTCTLNAKENEDNVAWAKDALGAEIIGVPTEPSWHITPSLRPTLPDPVYRFIPGVSRGEGLFMAIMRKPEGEDNPVRRKEKKGRKEKAAGHLPEEVLRWLCNAEHFTLRERGEELWAIPRAWEAVYDHLSALRIIHAGAAVALCKGRNVLPHPALALSQAFDRTTMPAVEADTDTALRFLRRDAVVLPPGTPQGFTTITYRHLPLGMVKNIGTRCNNLYPQEWRIRSSHTPENQPSILTTI